jgi:hypothetical protein
MKISAFIILGLCAASVLSQQPPKHVTLGSIVNQVFAAEYTSDQLIFEGRMKTAAKTFSFTSSQVAMKRELINRGFSGYVADNIALNIVEPVVGEFKASKIVSWMQSEYSTVSTVCIYRGTAQKFSVDFTCVVGTAVHDAATDIEVIEAVKRIIYTEMKEAAFSLNLKYHVFTEKTLEQFSGLKSAQTQADLGNLMKNEAGQREQVVYELNANKNDPFIARLFKNGLTHFTSSAVIESIEGVDTPYLTEFSHYLADKLTLPAGIRSAFIDQLYLASISDRSEWKDISFVYKLNVGEAKYMSVMTVTDEPTNTMDFVVCDIKAGFQMAPDIIVSTVKKSSFFGLFSSTSIRIDRRPAELTDKSIDLLFKFFKVSAFDKFRQFRGF